MKILQSVIKVYVGVI